MSFYEEIPGGEITPPGEARAAKLIFHAHSRQLWTDTGEAITNWYVEEHISEPKVTGTNQIPTHSEVRIVLVLCGNSEESIL